MNCVVKLIGRDTFWKKLESMCHMSMAWTHLARVSHRWPQLARARLDRTNRCARISRCARTYHMPRLGPQHQQSHKHTFDG
jgi:hypothetical protein